MSYLRKRWGTVKNLETFWKELTSWRHELKDNGANQPVNKVVNTVQCLLDMFAPCWSVYFQHINKKTIFKKKLFRSYWYVVYEYTLQFCFLRMLKFKTILKLLINCVIWHFLHPHTHKHTHSDYIICYIKLFETWHVNNVNWRHTVF